MIPLFPPLARPARHIVLATAAAALISLFLAGATHAATPLAESVQLAAGEFHTCALDRQGAVSCWGSNRHGQLGTQDASTAVRQTPAAVAGLGSGVRALGAGQHHTCAVLSNGAARCWGRNTFGQLGDGGTTDRPQPVDVALDGETLLAIAAGEDHTCAVAASGRVLCWGRNDFGQLGDGRTAASSRPVTVLDLPQGATQIALGRQHSCAVSQGGAWCWGANEAGQLGDGGTTRRGRAGVVTGQASGIRQLAAGRAHTCALAQDGAVHCWGANGDGQLGDGTPTTRHTRTAVALGDARAVAIGAGLAHTCAALADGSVRCWGENFFGQLGDGSAVGRLAPTPVAALGGTAVNVTAGHRHACAVLGGGGEVRCWGNNFDGQLGDASSSARLLPRPVVGLAAGMERLGTGFQHGCAFGTAQAPMCWGDNARGQLSNGTTLASERATATVGLPAGLRQIVGGTYHACALTAGGGVVCWGDNATGQLGDGTLAERRTPVDVLGLSSGVTAIAAGAFHACAVVANGTVRCWGSNTSGQLGMGGGPLVLEPQLVQGIEGATAVSAGYDHSCALLRTGAVKCWGANQTGQLGDLTTTTSAAPVEVSGLQSGVLAIASGGSQLAGGFNCALRAGGAVMCWGGNSYGQLGDGTTLTRLGPVDALGLGGGVRAIEVSSFHACAINLVGTMLCWGRNLEGQLGINSTQTRSVPTPVAGLGASVASISLGGGQSCALLEGGAVRCWGANNFGQVGDDTTWGRRTPVAVVRDPAPRAVVSLTPGGDDASLGAETVGDGRYVVFQSRARNLANGDDDASFDVYRVDRDSGATLRVSLDDAQQPLAGDAIEPSPTHDGALVAFVAADAAVGFVHGETEQARSARRQAEMHGVFLRDLGASRTYRLGDALPGGTDTAPRLSASGNRAVWTRLGPGDRRQVYSASLARADGKLQIGAARCLTCFVPDANGADTSTSSAGDHQHPTLSADGRVIAWDATVASLDGTPGACAQAASTVLVRDLSTARPPVAVSVPAPGANCGAANRGSQRPQLDGDGRRVVFESTQPLTVDDANAASDVYLHDLQSGALRLLSAAAGGTPANGASNQARISHDGSTVAFVSTATNLDAAFADNNGQADLHVVSTQGGATLRLSQSASGGESAQASLRPSLSADGALVSFDSTAANLSQSPVAGKSQVQQRVNPLAGLRLTSSTWWNPQESGWGLFVFDQGTVQAPAWFTYDDDGEPMWLIGAALRKGSGHYEGELFRFTGVPFNRSSGRVSDLPRPAGRIALHYGDDGRLRFDYTVDGHSRSRTLTRFDFGDRRLLCEASDAAARAAATNYSDVWWGGGDNSGWGLFVTHLGAKLYALWYTYDADGEPLFLTLVADRQADGSFRGPLLRQRDGIPLAQIDGSPASSGATTVGEATLRFDGGERGSFSYTLADGSDTRPISRFLFGSVPSLCTDVPD